MITLRSLVRCPRAPVPLCLALLLAAAPLAAQGNPPPGRPRMVQGQPSPQEAEQRLGQMMPGQDPVMRNLFSPEMIMQNQEAIGLTEEQRSAMMQEMQRTQQAAQQIQWRLQAAIERLSNVLQQPRPDEGQAMSALDSVLATEREMKRSQIGLLVRLKSRLTPEQQAFLRGRMGRRED